MTSLASVLRPRLVPGGRIVEHPYEPDDPALATVLLVAPDEEMATVMLPAADLRLLVEVLRGERDAEEAGRDAEDGELLAEILAECRAAGLLAEPDPPVPVLDVLLLGQGRIADQVTHLLEQDDSLRVQPVSAPPGEHAVAARAALTRGPVGVVVACADVLPDAAWQELDAVCAETATTWHRAYAEGTRVAVGPCTVPGGAATYRDLRVRRLAASSWPDELAALWRHLDTAADPGPCAVPLPVCAIGAGHLALDLADLAAGRNPSGVNCQVVVSPDGPAVTRHPVLPVPPFTGGPR